MMQIKTGIANGLERRHPCLHESRFDANKSGCGLRLGHQSLYATEAAALQARMPAIQSGASLPALQSALQPSCVIIKTLPALSAEPAGIDILPQERARPVLRIADTLVKHVEDRKTDIEPDE